MTCSAVIDLLWQRRSDMLFVTREQFEAGLEGWDIETFDIDGAPVLVFLRKGPEFHFSSLGTGRPISMNVVRAALQGMLDEHGYVTTRTPKHEERQHRFNRLIGFRQVGEDEHDIHYRLEGLRSRPCPS